MESLIELVHVLSSQKARHNKPLIDTSELGPKMALLYTAIRDGEITSDAEGRALIYGDQPSHKSYSNLKNRLEKRLLNSLFLIDINKSSFNETNVAYYESFRHWAAVKVLIQRKSYKTGLKLAEKLFTIAVKYELHEITISIARDLRRIYSVEKKNDQKHKKYHDAFLKFHPIYMIEIEAEEIFILLSKMISQSINYNYSAVSQEIDTKLNRLEKLEYDSYNFNKYLLISLIYREQIKGKYENVLNICDRGINYFESKNFPAYAILTVFYNRKVLSLIYLRRFFEALLLLEKTIIRSEAGTHNWHLSKILLFYVNAHLKKYSEAFGIYISSSDKKMLKNVSQNVKEFWRVYHAYLQFLIARKKLVLKEVDKRRFSIHRFLNEVPQYSKDKQGLHVAILIIHALFLLHLRRYSAYIDRMEPLQLYTYRYLRRDSTFRSNCFIKMLVQLPKGNFNKIAVERRVQKYWVKLQTAPVDVSNQQTTLEIIPYEDLWVMVVEMLD